MTRTSLCPSSSRQRGVSVITAVFLLLLLAGLAALMANVISTAHTTSAEDVQGERAYQAARAGVEWGLYRVLENNDAQTPLVPDGSCNPPVSPIQLNGCPATDFPVANLDGHQVNFNCEQYPSGAGAYYQEGCRVIRLFRLTARATAPGPNGLTIEREVQVTAEKCLDATTGRDC
ncbi:MAG TPA: hypothetical protein VFF03_09505 [Rhodocyclaceae bacterium]|nr:hypothetical protein [Rhodocyclaceae bacterium]